MPKENTAREMPTQLAIPEPKTALTPAELLQMAISRDADIDKLQRLMELQERWEANEARKAFVAAMKRFKDNPPQITKNKHVQFGTTNYHHATLDHVCEAVTKGLSAVGITHAWKVAQDNGVITVSCVLTHELGHSEATQLMGQADTSGSKNAIQAIGSTVTYLQRYTLLSACGLAASNDDDGKNGGGNSMDAAQVEEFCRQMTEVGTEDELKKVFAKSYALSQTANDYKSMGRLIQAKDAAKKRLTCR